MRKIKNTKGIKLKEIKKLKKPYIHLRKLQKGEHHFKRWRQ